LAHPLAGALRARSIKNVVNKKAPRFAVRVMCGEIITCDFDQVAIKLAMVPLVKDMSYRVVVESSGMFEQPVGFTD